MKGDEVKPFFLLRHVDLTGVSGTGIVAHGSVLPSGRVVLEWTASNHPTITIMNNIDEVILLHGHDGNSEIVMGNPPKKRKNKK